MINNITPNMVRFIKILRLGAMKHTFSDSEHQVTSEKELLKQIGHYFIFLKKSMDDPYDFDQYFYFRGS